MKRETLTESMRRLSNVVTEAEQLDENLGLIFKTPKIIDFVSSLFKGYKSKGEVDNIPSKIAALERQLRSAELSKEEVQEMLEVLRRLQILRGSNPDLAHKLFGPHTRPKQFQGDELNPMQTGTRGGASLRTDFKRLAGRALTDDELEFLSSADGSELAQDLTDLGNLYNKLGLTDTLKVFGQELEQDLVKAMSTWGS